MLSEHDAHVDAGAKRKLAYTVQEAAELLSISRAQLYRLLDLCELGSITIGRSRRITASQLEEFVRRLEARDWRTVRDVIRF